MATHGNIAILFFGCRVIPNLGAAAFLGRHRSAKKAD
jgi:hypothetical protein